MRPSWFLPPLAALFLGGALWVVFRGTRVEPARLLAEARTRLEHLPEDIAARQKSRSEARARLDLALRQARSAGNGALRAELLLLRADLNQAEGLHAMALEDCRARLELGLRDADTLARTCALLLRLGQPGEALAFAGELAGLDPARGHAFLGSAHVDLSDAPLASLEGLVHGSLSPARAKAARALARRAAALGSEETLVAPAREELLEFFPRSDERRRAAEWVREAGSELATARREFLTSLEHGPTSLAVVGLQDLCLRAGLDDEAAELGTLALSQEDLADPMRLLLRTASALVSLGRERAAKDLVRRVQKRLEGKLRHDDLPSEGLSDELAEWCALLARLESWHDLGQAAWALQLRAADSRERAERARISLATACVRTGNFSAARVALEALGTGPLVDPGARVETWLLQAELARALENRGDERFALRSLDRDAPLDPPEPLRARLAQAWERLADVQLEDGQPLAASESLTRALRCSGPRAKELEQRWHEVGARAVESSSGLPSSYGLYLSARGALRNGNAAAAADAARYLLDSQPGLAPALEVASAAAEALHNYPRLIESTLELLERGSASSEASARLRNVPASALLAEDRVRWIELDPVGSLEPILRRLLARGDRSAAARLARTAAPERQPEEVRVLLSTLLLESGNLEGARAALATLPPSHPAWRAATALALELATRRDGDGASAELARTLALVRASGPPADPGLVGQLATWIADGRLEEAAELATWLADERTPFLVEALLAQGVLDVLSSAPSSEALERAAALTEDGRAELGRLLLVGAGGDLSALASEARTALASPLAADPGRALALRILAGERERVVQALVGARLDGRALELELAAACALGLYPADLQSVGAQRIAAPAFLFEGLAPERFLLLVLAAGLPPFSAWVLQATAARGPALADDPSLLALRARAELALARPSAAKSELARAGERIDARMAWLRLQALVASGAPARAREDAELGWFTRSGRLKDEDAEFAHLRALRAQRNGDPAEAVRVLERAAGEPGAAPDLLARLAELEDRPGRRTRAVELYAQVLAEQRAGPDDPRMLACLEALRAARDEGEISVRRWWAEVEALEAEHPEDPAPVRELAARAFEEAGEEGRTQALARLARFRARTLDRPVEGLRRGEALRWTRLLARFTPEGAVRFAEEELRRDPIDPALWHASAEALLAAGRTRAALERLEAINQVAPATETARLLLQHRYELDRSAESFQRQLAVIRKLDPSVKNDPVLLFLGHVADLEGRGQGPRWALELWESRATNGLADPDFGRLLALALFAGGAQEAALRVLGEARELAPSALEDQVLAGLQRLIEAAPPPEPEEPAGTPSSAEAETAAGTVGDAPTSVDDAPAQLRPAGGAEGEPPPKPAAEGPVKARPDAPAEGGRKRPKKAAKEREE
jgi:thioredoxin-like negative regulator of GroEL